MSRVSGESEKDLDAKYRKACDKGIFSGWSQEPLDPDEIEQHMPEHDATDCAQVVKAIVEDKMKPEEEVDPKTSEFDGMPEKEELESLFAFAEIEEPEEKR